MHTKGDFFFHKEHNAFFMIDTIETNRKNETLYVCFFPSGHPNRERPWAKYTDDKMDDVAVKITDEKMTKAMRILYER